jgi:hemerythrin-like domain-containing protein
MLFEHEMTKQLAEKMDASAKAYIQTGNAEQLIADIRNYTDHVSQHLTKENFRLFAMADMMLNSKAAQVNEEFAKTEQAKLQAIGKTRAYYEQLVDSYDAEMRRQA